MHVYTDQIKTIVRKTPEGATIITRTVLNGVISTKVEKFEGKDRHELRAAFLAARPGLAALIEPTPEGGSGT